MPDSTLDTWRLWNCGLRSRPRIARELPGGLTNRSFLIDGGNQRLVMRVNRPDAGGAPGEVQDSLGIDRHRERQIVLRASAAGLMPPVYYCSPEQGMLVSAFVEGEHPQVPVTDSGRRQRLVALVERIHKLQVSCAPIDYLSHAEHYWQQIRDRGLPVTDNLGAMRETMGPILESFQSANPGKAICHHDLVPENIVDSGDRLYLLDWEYAAPGHPAFDYGILEEAWGIDRGAAGQQEARQVYRYLCELWRLLRNSSR